ncbi:TetR/AcrR family transcriptional regulator [Mesorhizobium sp. AaZ16]|uniref:TetR/AcrR family transcriptional regulator n=1 Tax=Mesorhizobium sp. AaZ16 TaxID=3402289 RepID=UPI00374FB908
MQDAAQKPARTAAAARHPPRARKSIGAVRSPETHRAILAAAAEILDEVGYTGFSMDALARRASSSKPTIYRWWRNKAALIMEVYEDANEAALAGTDTGSLRGDLISRLRGLWTWWDDSWAGEALRSVIAEAQLDAATLDELRNRFIPRRSAFVRLVFDRAVARGKLRDGPGVDIAVAQLVAMSWFHLLTRRLGEREAIEPHVDAVLKGLEADKAYRPPVKQKPVKGT